jgi:DNA-binding transcriptional MerR regulator
MLIGEVADAVGLTPKTLRFYEDEGLLRPPERTPGGYRDYHPAVIERLRFIRHAQGAGLRLREIRQVLEIRDGGRPPCEHVRVLIDERLREVEDRIGELERTRDQLHELAGRAREVDPSACGSDEICAIVGPSG